MARLIEEILAVDTRASVLARLAEADVPYGALNDVADLIAHPQLAARDRWYDVPSPAGPIRAFRPPFNLRGLPRQTGGVPGIGEHTEALRRELGLAD